jgi:hypothetical protein
VGVGLACLCLCLCLTIGDAGLMLATGATECAGVLVADAASAGAACELASVIQLALTAAAAHSTMAATAAATPG